MDSETTEEGGAFGTAFLLTLLSGTSTGLGGVVVLLIGQPSVETVGLMEAFAAGVMIYLSLIDLALPAAVELGPVVAIVAFLLGSFVFWCLSQIPMPSVVALGERLFNSNITGSKAINTSVQVIEPATSPEALPREGVCRKLVFDHADVSMEEGFERRRGDEILSSSQRKQQDPEYSKTGDKGMPALLPFLRAAVITAIAISLHNFPEGVAVYLTSLKGMRVGVVLAVGIALHNIPEGMSVAAPIYYITKSKLWTVVVPLVSGMFEPLGALMAGLFLYYVVTPTILQFLLSMVAGVMCFLSFYELLPISVKHSGLKECLVAMLIGMVACFFATGLVGEF